nr:CHAT domain-containing protein [Streptomyces sp. SA15]
MHGDGHHHNVFLHQGPLPDAPSGPRLWWSPTGPLTLLPLHMAGRHDGSRDNVLDRVVSSYATTVKALRHARSRPIRTSRRPLAGLLVSQPFTGCRFLRDTDAEAGLLRRRFPNCEVLPAHRATRKGISRLSFRLIQLYAELVPDAGRGERERLDQGCSDVRGSVDLCSHREHDALRSRADDVRPEQVLVRNRPIARVRS